MTALLAARGPGTRATLRVNRWEGPLAEPGDLVHSTGGSWYEVEERRGRSLRVVRLGRDVGPGPDAVVHEWTWDRR